jgi:hypothetical protein
MSEPSSSSSKQNGIIGLVQKRSGARIRGRLVLDRPLCTSINPVESVSLKSHQMKSWNGGTLSTFCFFPVKRLKAAGANRIRSQGGGLSKKLMLTGKP